MVKKKKQASHLDYKLENEIEIKQLLGIKEKESAK